MIVILRFYKLLTTIYPPEFIGRETLSWMRMAPGNRHPERRALNLKGLQIERTDNAKIGLNRNRLAAKPYFFSVKD
jgi:hypothetical protein